MIERVLHAESNCSAWPARVDDFISHAGSAVYHGRRAALVTAYSLNRIHGVPVHVPHSQNPCHRRRDLEIQLDGKCALELFAWQ